MPLVTREFQIIYGSLTIGAGTDYIIDGTTPISLDVNYSVASVTATVIVTAATEAAFNTACDNLEDAFRTPRQRLRVILGATTMWDYNPSTNTGFNARPSVTKPGSRHDTGRSRRYQIRVEVDLPADLTGQNGRATSSVNLTETDSRRRRLIVSGTYTAIGVFTARGAYEAGIDPYVAALLNAFGGTWEGPFDIRAEADDANKILQFSRTYEELIYDQSVGTLDNTLIRRQAMSIERLLEAPGDSTPGRFANRLATVIVSYEAAIDSDQTQDLSGTYTSVIKPWLLANARNVAGSTSQALVAEKTNFDPVENRISARLTILAAGNSSLISITITTADSEDRGVVLVPVWNGERHAKHEFQGPASFVRTITTVARELEGSAGQRNFSGPSVATDPLGIFSINTPLALDFGNDAGASSDDSGNLLASPRKPPERSQDGGSFIGRVLSSDTTETHLTLGRLGDPQMNVKDTTIASVIAYFVKPAARNG